MINIITPAQTLDEHMRVLNKASAYRLALHDLNQMGWSESRALELEASAKDMPTVEELDNALRFVNRYANTQVS